jgi:hypothetical protein
MSEQWRHRLLSQRGRRIGIAWRGNPKKRHDPQRSIPVEALQEWFEASAAKNYSVVALQRDANPREREWLAQFPHVGSNAGASGAIHLTRVGPTPHDCGD